MDALTVSLMTGLALLALISLVSLRRVPQGFTFTVDRLR
jgi:hypothetical protein